MENMNVRVECWPVAADNVGIWLISGEDALRPALPLDSADDTHFEVENLLQDAGVDTQTSLIHSTSWRPDGGSIVLTYIAVVQADGMVIDTWPNAKPVSLALAEAVGQPPVHAATEPPVPRYIDVLLHALRHIRFLLDTDDESAAGVTLPMRRHLEKLRPALACMYKSA